ncbi:MAG: Glycosyl transferase GT2 family [Candidatus Magasanikbacteria bacterium GW2011_GWA2_41_55]|uniref:Glycosyl transferase GT2 family n=1 Tax=Candidatus Magasanikbacteria bacterium GW2011_GWA2_41_55 TaxID=1619038 RepID=A0A0G0WMW9_9BACT|nr:MAG: Glycosyl transferase GT2 family [Candidatus Magasanikbacteria bacterium GW2011_GWA2_41_55]
MKLSVIIPVYNEEENVKFVHGEVLGALERMAVVYEIIFINDGSFDGTLTELKKLKPVKIISFRKNFGQTAAMDAGIKEAKGDLIITMDGDGQNDPADIAKMIEKIKSDDLDIVSGWRKKREDPFFKKLSSNLAAKLRKFLINDGIRDSGCTLKVYKKECFEHIDLSGEMHRFIPALLKIKGFKAGEIEVNHRRRMSDKTKYGIGRGMRGFFDMMSVWFWKKYANRPLHLFGTIGLTLIFISGISITYALYEKIAYGFDLSNTALTNLSMFGFLIGVQFFAFGLISDILLKNYFASTKDKIYEIKEVIENK